MTIIQILIKKYHL